MVDYELEVLWSECFIPEQEDNLNISPASRPFIQARVRPAQTVTPVLLAPGNSEAWLFSCLLWHPWENEGPYWHTPDSAHHLLACVAVILSSAGEILC